MQPASHGRLRLRSPDPQLQPWIEFRMLSEERDRAAMRYGVRSAFSLARQTALSQVSTNASASGLAERDLSDDPALDHWLRTHCEEFFHAVGTCRMGAKDDPSTVVDPGCRVLSVENLLACDASIFPSPPRAPTHLSAVMLAEHLSEGLC
jgi:choline dehydrogenase